MLRFSVIVLLAFDLPQLTIQVVMARRTVVLSHALRHALRHACTESHG